MLVPLQSPEGKHNQLILWEEGFAGPGRSITHAASYLVGINSHFDFGQRITSVRRTQMLDTRQPKMEEEMHKQGGALSCLLVGRALRTCAA